MATTRWWAAAFGVLCVRALFFCGGGFLEAKMRSKISPKNDDDDDTRRRRRRRPPPPRG